MGRGRSQGDQDDRDQRDDLEEEEGSEEDTSEEQDLDEEDEESDGSESEDDEDFDPERWRDFQAATRQEIKTLKERNRELERKNKQFERKNQSRDERLQSDLGERDTRIQELETENSTLAEQVQRSSFIEKMTAAGFTQRQARIAWKDRDELGVDPEFDERRQLTNPKAIRKAAKEFDPEFYATGSADGGSRERGDRGESAGSMNDLIRGAAGRA